MRKRRVRADFAGSVRRHATEGALGPEIEVEIAGLAPGGDAVGHQVGGAADGRATFVPFAAPGERVRARVVRGKARVAWAELVAVERSSPARVPPPCPLFGRCGGCQWQHVDEVTQRRAKGAIVGRALGVEIGEARAVGPVYGYRERARLAVGEGAAGRVVGYRMRRSHAVLDVLSCPLLAPPLDAALPVLRAHAARLPAGSEVAALLGRSAAGEVVAAELGAQGLAIRAGAVAPFDPDDPEAWPDVAEPGARPLRVPPGGFAQVGRAGNRALVAAVMDALGDRPGRVLELHAGSGNFTRALVARAPVIASDGDAVAMARGRRNVPEADWRSMAALAAAPPDVDTAVVDPPRDGLDAASLALAARGRRVVYVSCDPQTLARDVRALGARGFALGAVAAFDLMPQTHHVEVVASLTR